MAFPHTGNRKKKQRIPHTRRRKYISTLHILLIRLSNYDEIVKNLQIVILDVIPAKDGIFDRHPEHIELTGLRLEYIPHLMRHRNDRET
jgi:hypothetical protein